MIVSNVFYFNGDKNHRLTKLSFKVMDATQKTEDEVCTALHDCDNDANRAVNYLLEGSCKVCNSTVCTKYFRHLSLNF